MNAIVNNIAVYSTPAPNAPQYTLTGSGLKTSLVSSALSDASATYIDATGITKATALTTANKNCLITASAGMVTNPGNVIVGGICDNLALADGAYNFRAPANFTATSVSYDRSFTADNISTICLPFPLTADEVTAAGNFYQLSGVSGSTLTFDKVTTTEANKPYLFVAKTTGTISFEGGKSVVAASTFETVAGGASLIGTMTAQTLKSDGSQTLYGYKGGEFVKVGTTAGAKINPFRAYIAVAGSSLAPSFSIELNDADVTGIKTVAPQNHPQFGNCYDLSGRRMTNSPDAPTAKGLYIVNGKKYIVK